MKLQPVGLIGYGEVGKFFCAGHHARGAKKLERAPPEVIDDAVARLMALFEQ